MLSSSQEMERGDKDEEDSIAVCFLLCMLFSVAFCLIDRLNDLRPCHPVHSVSIRFFMNAATLPWTMARMVPVAAARQASIARSPLVEGRGRHIDKQLDFGAGLSQ